MEAKENEVVNVIKNAMEVLTDKHVRIGRRNYGIIVTSQVVFHQLVSHNYAVIGTKLIVGPWMLNKKYKRVSRRYTSEFEDIDLSYAEFYMTRNEAIRAISRNRRCTTIKREINSNTVIVNGEKLIYAPRCRVPEGVYAVCV